MIVLHSWGGQGAKAGGIGYSESVSPTLKSVPSGGNTIPDTVYTMKSIARNGKTMSECANPICQSDYKDSDVVAYSIDCRNDKMNTNISGTLQEKNNSLQSQNPVVYNISPYESNCMKSSNPNSGIQKVDTARTLDLNGGNPACNQGGEIVVGYIDNVGGQAECYNGQTDVTHTLRAEAGTPPPLFV